MNLVANDQTKIKDLAAKKELYKLKPQEDMWEDEKANKSPTFLSRPQVVPAKRKFSEESYYPSSSFESLPEDNVQKLPTIAVQDLTRNDRPPFNIYNSDKTSPKTLKIDQSASPSSSQVTEATKSSFNLNRVLSRQAAVSEMDRVLPDTSHIMATQSKPPLPEYGANYPRGFHPGYSAFSPLLIGLPTYATAHPYGFVPLISTCADSSLNPYINPGLLYPERESTYKLNVPGSKLHRSKVHSYESESSSLVSSDNDVL